VFGVEGKKFGIVFDCASSDLEIGHANCLWFEFSGQPSSAFRVGFSKLGDWDRRNGIEKPGAFVSP